MKKAVLILMMAMSAFVIHAQVGINTETPSSNAALQINKGQNDAKTAILPALTDGEGKAIPTGNVSDDGMMYYNTTTGCFEYYVAAYDMWFSLCGTMPPAQVEFNDCGAIKVNGNYFGGTALTPANYISIPVTVITPGTYDMTAEVVTGPNEDAYFFQTSGVFSKTGTFVVNLMGTGTPTIQTGTPTIQNTVQIDALGILCNNKPAPCFPTVTVQTPNPDYRIISATAYPALYPEATPLAAASSSSMTYFVSVQLQVNTPGTWQLAATDVNGYGFSGSGDIASASGYNPNGTFPQIVTVQVPAHGMAASYTPGGIDAFSIHDIGSATPSSCLFNVYLAEVGFSIDCPVDLSQLGTLKQNNPLPVGSKITVPITISTQGETTLTASFAGVIYSGEITSVMTGQQNIILTPNPATGQQPNNSGTALPISFYSSHGGITESCVSTVAVTPAIVAFTSITLTQTSYSATINPVGTTATNSIPNIPLSYTATVSGKYELASIADDTQKGDNGITYTATGNIMAGSGTITLTPSGTPTKNGSFTYQLWYDVDGNGSDDTFITFTVIYAYKTINILGLGTWAYYPGNTYDNNSPANTILASTVNFGPEGTYPVGGIKMFNGGTEQGTALMNDINNNKIDIIVVGYGYDPNATSNAILKDFVATKKGVLMFADENTSVNQVFMRNLYGNTMTTPGSQGGDISGSAAVCSFNTDAVTAKDPILKGPFGDVSNISGSMTYFGLDASTGWTYPTNQLPSSAINLVNGPTGYSQMFRDDTLGFLYIGDGGWIVGASGQTTNYTGYPCVTTGTYNEPGTKLYQNNHYVANAIVYANAIAWAIDYVMANEVPTYQVHQ